MALDFVKNFIIPVAMVHHIIQCHVKIVQIDILKSRILGIGSQYRGRYPPIVNIPHVHDPFLDARGNNVWVIEARLDVVHTRFWIVVKPWDSGCGVGARFGPDVPRRLVG